MFRDSRLAPRFAFLWIFGLFLVHSASATPRCGDTFDLEANTVWRGGAGFGEHTFRWGFPTSGIATVDLLTSDGAGARLDLRDTECGGDSAEIAWVDRSAGRLVVAVRSGGSLFLAAEAEAPYRLVTSFVGAEVFDEAVELSRGGALGVRTSFLVTDLDGRADPEVVDPDPDGLPELHHLSGRADPEVVDPDPDGMVAGPTQPVLTVLTLGGPTVAPAAEAFGGPPEVEAVRALSFEPTCRPVELDDHGDTSDCATLLLFGRGANGEILNDWGDDVDVFSVRVTEVSRVQIAWKAAHPGITFDLLGPAGHRLAVETRMEGDRGALVTHLVPGRYLLRVTGISGSYRVRATAQP
ncbi:MAG: hypothetical protein AAGD06_30860 [Acidobacteriota bacterium]